MNYKDIGAFTLAIVLPCIIFVSGLVYIDATQNVWAEGADNANLQSIESSPAHNMTYVQFLDKLHTLKDTIHDDWTRAVAVTDLVRSIPLTSQFTGPGINETKDFNLLYNQMIAGHPVLCNDMGTMLEAAFSFIGTRSVRYQLTAQDGFSTHVTVDVWLDDRQIWVNIDPTFAGYWVNQGTDVPLSTPQVHDLVHAGKLNQIQFVPFGDWTSPRPDKFVSDIRLEFYNVDRTNPILP